MIDTNPTLTEDDIVIDFFYTNPYDSDELLRYYCRVGLFNIGSNEERKQKALEMKQQILTALDQYPKLKEELEQSQNMIKWLSHESDQFSDFYKKENQKLKAENEELKKHLPDMTKWTIGIIIKELEEHPEYTYSEILKRHRELYFGSPSSKYLEELEESNKAHIEACGQWNEKYYKLQQENNQLKQLKQRLENRIKELQEFPKNQYSSTTQVKLAYSLESELQQLLKDDIK